MIIKCPNCSAKFNLPDEAFKEGAKARCSECKHIFTLSSDDAPAGNYSMDDADEAAESEMDFGGDEADSSSQKPDSGSDASDSAMSFNLDEPGDGASKKKAKKQKNESGEGVNKVLLAIVVLLVLVVGGGAGLYFFAPQYISFLSIGAEPEPEEPAEDPAAAAERLRNIALQNVQQYYISNEKLGSLVIIDGWVVNNFKQPKDLIKVEASLIDGQGQVVAKQERLAGNKLSLFQLQTLTAEEIEAELGNKVGILTNNTNIPPGGEVEFMVVFPQTPENVQEFEVRVVEVQDPPK